MYRTIKTCELNLITLRCYCNTIGAIGYSESSS